MMSLSLASVLHLNSESDFFSVIHSRRFVLALLTKSDPSTFQNLSGSFDSASESDDFRKVVFVRVDLSSAPGLAGHYELDSNTPIGLFLFVRNQLVKFDSSDPKIMQKIKKRLSRFGRAGDVAAVEEEIKNSGLVFVLLGRESSNRVFRRVEESNIALSFLRVPEASEARRLFRQKLGAEKPKKTQICVARKDSSVLDPAFECREMGGLASTMRFVQFEQFPRLRTPEMHPDILKFMFWRKEVVMFLSAGGNSHQIEEFKNALKVLPKNMIYAITDSSEPEPTFIQIFMLAKAVQSPSTVYIAFAVPGSDVRLQSMTQSITKENVITFAEDFRKRNQWMFEESDTEVLRELVGENPEDSLDLEEINESEEAESGEVGPNFDDFEELEKLKSSDDGLESHESVSEDL